VLGRETSVDRGFAGPGSGGNSLKAYGSKAAFRPFLEESAIKRIGQLSALNGSTGRLS
jgi:hypothetical protein